MLNIWWIKGKGGRGFSCIAFSGYDQLHDVMPSAMELLSGFIEVKHVWLRGYAEEGHMLVLALDLLSGLRCIEENVAIVG
ncbi:hypothetical protein E2542_SST28477 [Spatholobus suberectus]|nr:hypothetical protein E2542_SST28477 [Spatholobus suberectus]